MKNNILKTTLILIAISIFSSSCYRNFYLTNTQKSINTDIIKKAIVDSNKILIIHFNDSICELTNYSITNQTIEGDIRKIEIPELLMYSKPEENSSNRYKKKYAFAILNVIHIYTTLKFESVITNHIQLSAKEVNRIDVYTKDKNRTVVNHVLSTFGVVSGLLLLSVTIFLLGSGPIISGPIILFG